MNANNFELLNEKKNETNIGKKIAAIWSLNITQNSGHLFGFNILEDVIQPMVKT